jgi:hypothetical protein
VPLFLAHSCSGQAHSSTYLPKSAADPILATETDTGGESRRCPASAEPCRRCPARIGVSLFDDGGVAEWSKAAVLKTVVPQGTVGSNPTSSAMTFVQSLSFLLTVTYNELRTEVIIG